MTQEQIADFDAVKWLDPIRGRMTADNAADLSDAEIERTLGPCVCGPRLVVAARLARDNGTLRYADLLPLDRDRK